MGRPSIDAELMIRMLIVEYVFAIRSERLICREVQVNLAYRWFCKLGIEDAVPDHSAFSRVRNERFREGDVFRRVFERVVEACIAAGLVGGEGFAVDASLIAADANKQRSIAGPDCALMVSLCGGGGTAGGAWIARKRSVGSGGAGRLRRRYRIKPQVLSNPGIHQAGGRKSAKQSQAVREFAGRVSDFRVRRVGRLQDRLGHDARLFGRCHHLVHSLGHALACLAIRIELGVRLHEVRVERRLRVRGLDDRDPDAPRAQLMVERF
jgi:Transposase domain (DUF772)